MKKFFLIFGLVLMTLVVGAWYLAYDIDRYAHTPCRPSAGTQIMVIPTGQGFSATTVQLLQAGLIEKPFRFRWFARINGYDKRIKAGEYRLSAGMTPAQLLDVLVAGKVVLHRITVPEGYNLHQIAGLVAAAGFSTKGEFESLARDSGFVHQLGIFADTFEGYLFPDTYFFRKGATGKDVIRTMVHRFNSLMTPEWKARAKALNLSLHEVTTLASIIEKETGVAEERPIISSVFHNRLRLGIPLASDPTVIYGLSDFDGNITRRHLKTKTPYNTYLVKGLPPGPIANPGKDALYAALYPKQTKLLYFVSKGDGTHQFSTTVKAHNRAVRKYQLKR